MAIKKGIKNCNEASAYSDHITIVRLASKLPFNKEVRQICVSQ